MLFIPPHIGWAKPVPINPYNLGSPRRDTVWVSLAGVTANMIMAMIFGLILRVLFQPNPWFVLPGMVVQMIANVMLINLTLAVFNLIPIPPMDGSRVLGGLLPPRLEREYRKLDRFGPFLILALFLAGYLFRIPILGMMIGPFVNFFASVFVGVTN
jgi:Zn-dependent protease